MRPARQIEITELRLDSPSPGAVVMREAILAYENAVTAWHVQRETGGIVPAPAGHDRDIGVRYVAATFEGGRVLVAFQKARAELNAAVANRRRELGDTTCRPCAGKEAV